MTAGSPAGTGGKAGSRITDRAVLGLVTALFALPNLVLAAGLRMGPGLAVALASLASLVLVVRAVPAGSDKPFRPIPFAACLALAFAILILGGSLHVFYANPDWLIRDAVLADIARHGFPLGYVIGGETYTLRAPLGMYLVPALAGRVGGLLVAHVALLGQNAVLLGAIFYLLLGLCRSALHLAILVGFGGLGILWRVVQGIALGEPARVVAWMRPLDEWNALLQYTSSITQFFWVPNHALPGWWLGTLFILCARRQVDVGVLGVAVGLLVLWSPLAVLGAVPVLALFAATRFREIVTARRTWACAVAAAGFLPAALYVAAAAGTIDHGSPAARPGFAPWYVVFVLLQLAAGGFALLHRERIEPALRGLFFLSLAVLVILPFFSFGPNNDLVMRSSIPALLVVAFVFGAVLLDMIREGRREAALGVAIAALGLAPALVEATRAVLAQPFAVSECDLVEASRNLGDLGAPANYMAPADRLPAWLMAPPSAIRPPPRDLACWPDLRRPDLAP